AGAGVAVVVAGEEDLDPDRVEGRRQDRGRGRAGDDQVEVAAAARGGRGREAPGDRGGQRVVRAVQDLAERGGVAGAQRQDGGRVQGEGAGRVVVGERGRDGGAAGAGQGEDGRLGPDPLGEGDGQHRGRVDRGRARGRGAPEDLGRG